MPEPILTRNKKPGSNAIVPRSPKTASAKKTGAKKGKSSEPPKAVTAEGEEETRESAEVAEGGDESEPKSLAGDAIEGEVVDEDDALAEPEAEETERESDSEVHSTPLSQPM